MPFFEDDCEERAHTYTNDDRRPTIETESVNTKATVGRVFRPPTENNPPDVLIMLLFYMVDYVDLMSDKRVNFPQITNNVRLTF